MPDWTKSMKQTFEYYIVDPGTWRDVEKVGLIESCSITRDSQVDTLGSATLTSDNDYSDKYIRSYLITEQNGIREKTVLGTHLYQSPSISYSSTRQTTAQDGYTPLIELSENPPQYGYSLQKGEAILARAAQIIRDHSRVPVVDGDNADILKDIFVSNTDDTWLTFVSDLVGNARYSLGLDEMGQIIFERAKDTASLTPVWTFNDDNSSILYPDVTMTRDLYGIPNVVEVIYSPAGSSEPPLIARVVNDDPSSPVSTVKRGREITYRDTSPNVVEGTSTEQLEEYAKNTLKEMSSLEYTLTYKHGYCPVKLGDCVMLNYKRAGLNGIKARVIRQVINCESGCAVEETAVFSKQLWG